MIGISPRNRPRPLGDPADTLIEDLQEKPKPVRPSDEPALSQGAIRRVIAADECRGQSESTSAARADVPDELFHRFLPSRRDAGVGNRQRPAAAKDGFSMDEESAQRSALEKAVALVTPVWVS